MARKKSVKKEVEDVVVESISEEPIVEEELVVEEVCEVEEEACDGYKAIRDISRQYRKGDLVPKAVVAKWEKMGIVISELVE